MFSREPRFSLGQTVKILLEDAPDFGIILQIEEDFNQFIYLIQGEFYTENELSEIDLFSPNFNAQKVFADIATDLQDSQNSPNQPRIPLFEDIFSINPNLLSASSKEIEYRDSTPKPFEIQIPLWEYFERIKRHKADRWQRDLCDRLQEALHSRYLRRWWAVIHAEGQLGKPVEINSLVLMGDGSYKRIGEIKKGDFVISHTGRPRKVLNVFKQGELECVKITTNCERETIAALDHPFLTPEGYINAEDLLPGQHLACVSEPQLIKNEMVWTDDDFEMLGYFIGDGCVTNTPNGSIQAAITSGDSLQTGRILMLAERFNWKWRISKKPDAKCQTYNFKNGVRNWIRKTGIAGTSSWTKRVPEWVFKGTQKQIGLFLGAYFSCDGTLTKNKNRKGGFYDTRTIEFNSVAENLLKDCQKLLLRLGIQSRVTGKNGKYYHQIHKSFRLYFASQDFNAQFAEKAYIAGVKGVEINKFKQFRKTFPAPFLSDMIVSIEKVGKKECRCLEVETDHTFTSDDFVVHNTSIISQCFPAWILGHLPSFRYALAMYNITQSQKHSDVVINIMTSATHTDIFPNKDGWLFVDEKAAFGRKISKAGWMTNARREINDSQFSFNPVGLRSGLTGAGYDWLSIDDPYRDSKDAFSPIINEGLKNFYDFTVQTRTSLYSCISGMFHRYAPEDLGGYLLDTGDFEYLRYCSQYDGPYIHEKTGRRYDDPIERKKGEYISPNRRPPHYYDKPRKKPRVWLSMFQGRPSSEFGDFFNVGKISLITKQEAAEREKECLLITRSYDLASSVSDEAAFSVGVKMGIRSNGRITIFDMWRERVDTAKRSKKQKELAAQDGPTVTVVIPKDPGQAGETTVFYIRQLLKGYNVATRETSGSKEERAHDFSVAVNDDLVEMVEYTGENPQDQDFNWNLQLKTELRDFPLSPYKDITDACADGYNQLFETWTRGTVVKNYKWYRNFTKVSDFMKKFAISSPNAEIDEEKLLPGLIEFSLPPKFAVYAAVKIDQDASKPTSAIIAARAPQFSQCPEDLFVLDEYKRYNANLYELFDWLESRLKTWQTSAEPTIWLHPDSEQYFQTISSKLPYRVSQFHEDKLAGHNELNWYLMPHDSDHPFGATTEQAAHLYFVCHDDYYYGVELKNENEPQSFYHLRQEAHTWGFGSNGEPTEVGQVLDCLRIITHRFKTYAENYTLEEEREMVASKYLPAKVQQAYSEGSLTMPMQQRIDFANHLAKLDMQDKYGEDVFEDALDNDLWFLVDS